MSEAKTQIKHLEDTIYSLENTRRKITAPQTKLVQKILVGIQVILVTDTMNTTIQTETEVIPEGNRKHKSVDTIKLIREITENCFTGSNKLLEY